MKKVYIVKANGSISTEDNSLITSYNNGKIINIVKKEGDWAENDDVLLEISMGIDGKEYSNHNNQRDSVQAQINAINKFINSLEQSKNLMAQSQYEKEYFEKVNYYLTYFNNGNSTNAYYQSEVNKLIQKKKKASEELTNLKEKYENSENASELELETLKNKIENMESEIDGYNSTIDQMKNQINNTQSDLLKNQLISEASATRVKLMESLSQINSKLDFYQTKESYLQIKSTNAGYVHYFSLLQNGNFIQEGQSIGEISKNLDYNVIAYVDSIDINKVEKGDKAKIAINGLNTQKYGTINGIVERIDTGITLVTNNEKQSIFYKCEISIDEKSLSSKSNDIVNIVKSQSVEARIIYDKETYFDWLLEQLNFK
ncbi:MAG: HlyD family efflux transporter periplasmic adaptor subunit [Malacoplasma sp.]